MSSPLLEEGSGPATLRSEAQGSSRTKDERQLAVLSHVTPIWRFLRRVGLSNEDADDVAQEVFLVATSKLDRIIPGQEKRFLFSVAVKIASRRRRSARTTRERIEEVDLDTCESTAPSTEELVSQHEALALLDEALAELSEDMRTVFVLYELEEMTVHEIARVIDLPVGTVASRLQRGRAQFQRATRRMQLTRKA